MDHIDYIVKRIGSTMSASAPTSITAPASSVSTMKARPNVTRELVRRGYDEAQIAKIWGGNFLRVFGEVEAVSRKLKKS